MFKKLRNKFLLLNLVTISVMMVIAFASIYIITYKNVRRDIDMEMMKISEPNRRQNPNPGQMRPYYDGAQPPPERSVAFTLITDKEWKTIMVASIFQMDAAFYETAKSSAITKNSTSGSFKLDGTYWEFLIRPHYDGYKITFLDITSRQAILTNLIYTFAAVALVMLVFIYFVSRTFANRSIKPVKEAFDKQKQFIADASHELKTPLAVINTNVDVLLSNGGDQVKDQAKWLNYIKSETERMSKLTNDLLYLTQVDYSDVKMIFTDFSLSETVENIILTMEAVIFEHNLSLQYDIEPGLFIHGNSEQLQQVAMILLDNAIKYTNSNGTVNIALKKHNNNVLLSVTNTGEGIAEEHIEKIFDRFYRTDKSRARKSGGYGLGLAIAKAIVEQHGGKISTKSILNESTTFSVELPRIHHYTL